LLNRILGEERLLTGPEAGITRDAISISTEWTLPDGTPRKLLDVGKLGAMGWNARIGLEAGIRAVYEEVRDKL
jgi:nucleoside-diphosphate-sugar epimerase